MYALSIKKILSFYDKPCFIYDYDKVIEGVIISARLVQEILEDGKLEESLEFLVEYHDERGTFNNHFEAWRIFLSKAQAEEAVARRIAYVRRFEEVDDHSPIIPVEIFIEHFNWSLKPNTTKYFLPHTSEKVVQAEVSDVRVSYTGQIEALVHYWDEDGQYKWEWVGSTRLYDNPGEIDGQSNDS